RPFASQRSHWYWDELGLLVHLPGDAVGREPSRAEPLIDGGGEFVGALPAATTTLVASEIACVGPAEFEAVTATRILCPTSAPLSRRLDDVAPEIAAQPLPAESQRSQPYA